MYLLHAFVYEYREKKSLPVRIKQIYPQKQVVLIDTKRIPIEIDDLKRYKVDPYVTKDDLISELRITVISDSGRTGCITQRISQ